jgi:LacI family transcriptional regulator
MRYTIKDVARQAGVSISTVSRVMNGKSVKKATRERVLTSISDLDFHPDQTARTMIMKETKTIGLVVPQLSNEFWAMLSEVLQEDLWNKGYTLILCSTNHQLDKEEAFIRMFIERKVDGIIFISDSGNFNQSCYSPVEKIRNNKIPVVTMSPELPSIDCVVCDNIYSATNAVEHLIRLAHRNIAYIGGPAIPLDREMGYRKALLMHGIVVNETLIRRGPGQTFQFGYEKLNELLATNKTFSAIFCGNDPTAIGAIQALMDSGIRVPYDVAVIGFDDIPMASISKPALTTVRQPIRLLSKELINMLLSSIENNGESLGRKIMIPTELVIRESCGYGLNPRSNNNLFSANTIFGHRG